MATAALVCGIVGLVMCWAFVPSAVALVLGLVAASRAKQTSDPRAGLGRARAGWIMGAIGVTLFALFIIGTIADLDEDSVDVVDLDVGDCVDVPEDSGRTEVLSWIRWIARAPRRRGVRRGGPHDRRRRLPR